MKASHRRKALKGSALQSKTLKQAETKLSQNALELRVVFGKLRTKLEYLSLSSSLLAENTQEHEELLSSIRNAPFDVLSVLSASDLSNAKRTQKAIDAFLTPIELKLHAASKEESAAQKSKAQPMML